MTKKKYNQNYYFINQYKIKGKRITSLPNFSINNARSTKYRASKLDLTPEWVDLEEIKIIYEDCPKGFHVDHIIPLQGNLATGLHTKHNLQYLEALENTTKKNIFEPYYEMLSQNFDKIYKENIYIYVINSEKIEKFIFLNNQSFDNEFLFIPIDINSKIAEELEPKCIPEFVIFNGKNMLGKIFGFENLLDFDKMITEIIFQYNSASI